MPAQCYMTGITADLGIELGKFFYWNRSNVDVDAHAVIANRAKLGIHRTMLASFFVGSLVGAIASSMLAICRRVRSPRRSPRSQSCL